jgi:hypothetical protein
MAGLLAVGTAGIMTLSGGESASAQQGSLTDLARRAIGGPGGAQTVTLMPGERAGDMPLNLPLPSGANVVGTIKRDFNPAPVKMWDLVIDVGASPADVGAFFDQALPAMGWAAPPPAGDQGAPQGAFCQSADGPWIGVVAVPVSETASDLRIHVESGSPGPCAGPQQPPAQ